MRFSAAVFLSSVASALAYVVTEPSASQGWTDSGPQTLAWTKVDTDPSNFTVVLTNTDRSVMAINNQVLAAQVDGSLDSVSLNPPSGGWPTGGTFRINLVKDPNSLDTILAQSSEFDIKAPAIASSSHASSGFISTTRTISSNTPLTPTATTSATTTSVPSSTKTDNPPTTNAGHQNLQIDFGLVPLIAAFGFFLA